MIISQTSFALTKLKIPRPSNNSLWSICIILLFIMHNFPLIIFICWKPLPNLGPGSLPMLAQNALTSISWRHKRGAYLGAGERFRADGLAAAVIGEVRAQRFVKVSHFGIWHVHWYLVLHFAQKGMSNDSSRTFWAGLLILGKFCSTG